MKTYYYSAFYILINGKQGSVSCSVFVKQKGKKHFFKFDYFDNANRTKAIETTGFFNDINEKIKNAIDKSLGNGKIKEWHNVRYEEIKI